MRPVAHPLRPLFDLRLRTANLELRLPTDDDLVDLFAVAKAGVHPPDSGSRAGVRGPAHTSKSKGWRAASSCSDSADPKRQSGNASGPRSANSFASAPPSSGGNQLYG